MSVMNVETVVFIEAYPMDNWSFEENYIIYIITYFKNKIKSTLSCSVNNRKAFPTKRHITYKFVHPMFCDNLYGPS